MSENKSPVFGVYFGNSTCCLSVNKNGSLDVIANASGERVTPALVGYQDSDTVVGTAARQGLVRHDRSSVIGALRAVGSAQGKEITFPLNLNCQLIFEGKRPKFVVYNGETNRTIPVQDVLKHLFCLLKDIAGSHSNEDKLPVVITLPSWVNNTSVSAVHASATVAGFYVIKTISQPAAACLAYDLLEDNKAHLNVLVFHCGGTSIVASLAEVSGGLLNVKETSYSQTASGDALTSILVQYFAKEFYMKYKGDPMDSKRSKRKLYSVAENCKHGLSTLNTAHVHVDSLWEGVDFSTQLSRARFDGLVASALSEFLGPVIEVLERADLSYDQIDKVILTGGSCKIPKLQSLIAEKFKNAEIVKKFPSDEVLSLGAAKEAIFYLEKKPKRTTPSSNSLLSCLSTPIYARVLGSKESQCIFTSGTSTHCRKCLAVECPTTGPSSIAIYEAAVDTEFPGDDQILAQVELDFMDNSSPISLQLDCFLKGDGSVFVKLTEPQSKTNKSFLIESGKR